MLNGLDDFAAEGEVVPFQTRAVFFKLGRGLLVGAFWVLVAVAVIAFYATAWDKELCDEKRDEKSDDRRRRHCSVQKARELWRRGRGSFNGDECRSERERECVRERE